VYPVRINLKQDIPPLRYGMIRTSYFTVLRRFHENTGYQLCHPERSEGSLLDCVD